MWPCVASSHVGPRVTPSTGSARPPTCRPRPPRRSPCACIRARAPRTVLEAGLALGLALADVLYYITHNTFCGVWRGLSVLCIIRINIVLYYIAYSRTLELTVGTVGPPCVTWVRTLSRTAPISSGPIAFQRATILLVAATALVDARAVRGLSRSVCGTGGGESGRSGGGNAEPGSPLVVGFPNPAPPDCR